MNQPITFAICGFGNRGRDAYAVYQKTHPDLMKIVAVADPVPQRLAAARQGMGWTRPCALTVPRRCWPARAWRM